MRIDPPFPMPPEPPTVPEHLSERITQLLPSTAKIALKVAKPGGWQAVTTFYLEGDEEAPEVYTAVKAGADYHCQSSDLTGKYRAQIWIMVEGKKEPVRQTVSFTVKSDGDADDAVGDSLEVQERREQISRWGELLDREHRLTEFTAEYSRYALDTMLKFFKMHTEQTQPMAKVTSECIGMFRDGLQMKADSVRELGELRIEQRLSEARHEDSSKMWEALAPALGVAASQFNQRFLQAGGGRARALPSPAPVPPSPMAPSDGPTPPANSRPPGAPVGLVPLATSVSASAPAAAPSAPAAAPSAPPIADTLHGLVGVVLDRMGPDRLVRMMRVLDDTQAAHFEAVSTAPDDDSVAEAIAALMGSLMTNPTVVVRIQGILEPGHIEALQQLAVLAQRHLEEREACRREGQAIGAADEDAAPSSSIDAVSSENNEPDI